MKKDYQITLICSTGQYKPVSCIITKDTDEITTIGKKAFVEKVRNAGIIKICQKRGWSDIELKKFHYTQVKMREYNKDKIEQENKERYEKLKEEKYKSGEWRKPAQ